MASLKTPDVTPVQVGAALAIATQAAHAFGVFTLTPAQSTSLREVLTSALGLGALDAVIRFGRSIRAGLEAKAPANATYQTHTDPGAVDRVLAPAAPVQDLSDSAKATPPAAAAALGATS